MKIIIYLFSFFFLFSSTRQQGEKEKPINIKVVPAKSNKLTLDDLDEIKMEVLHDMNSQLKDLEDEIAEKERLKEKTSNTWTLTGAPIYLPRNPVLPSMTIPNKHQIYVSEYETQITNTKGVENNPGITYNEVDQPKAPSSSFKELEQDLQEADEALEQLKKIKQNEDLSKVSDDKTVEQLVKEIQNMENTENTENTVNVGNENADQNVNSQINQIKKGLDIILDLKNVKNKTESISNYTIIRKNTNEDKQKASEIKIDRKIEADKNVGMESHLSNFVKKSDPTEKMNTTLNNKNNNLSNNNLRNKDIKLSNSTSVMENFKNQIHLSNTNNLTGIGNLIKNQSEKISNNKSEINKKFITNILGKVEDSAQVNKISKNQIYTTNERANTTNTYVNTTNIDVNKINKTFYSNTEKTSNITNNPVKHETSLIKERNSFIKKSNSNTNSVIQSISAYKNKVELESNTHNKHLNSNNYKEIDNLTRAKFNTELQYKNKLGTETHFNINNFNSLNHQTFRKKNYSEYNRKPFRKPNTKIILPNGPLQGIDISGDNFKYSPIVKTETQNSNDIVMLQKKEKKKPILDKFHIYNKQPLQVESDILLKTAKDNNKILESIMNRQENMIKYNRNLNLRIRKKLKDLRRF